MMTPKEAYELRKKAREAAIGGLDDAKEAAIADMLDRFVTAIETIAVTLEAARR